MTKVSMPEPVAYAVKAVNTLSWYSSVMLPAAAEFSGVFEMNPDHVGKLITTTQAEAYADAKVREALEDLVDTLETRQFGGQDQIVNVIRNLIPPLPGPVEPTT